MDDIALRFFKISFCMLHASELRCLGWMSVWFSEPSLHGPKTTCQIEIPVPVWGREWCPVASWSLQRYSAVTFTSIGCHMSINISQQPTACVWMCLGFSPPCEYPAWCVYVCVCGLIMWNNICFSFVFQSEVCVCPPFLCGYCLYT